MGTRTITPWADKKNVKLGPLCQAGHDHGGGSFRRSNRTCVECTAIAQRRWNNRNAARISFKKKEWRLSNLDRQREIVRKWYMDNREKREMSLRRWRINNRNKRNEYDASRRSKEKSAMPAWADKVAISAIYKEAAKLTLETGIKHHVDHIVPLQHRLVSGLHVPANLQILTASQNVRKNNHFIVAEGGQAVIDLDTAKTWAQAL